jgi:hypothetical protein
MAQLKKWDHISKANEFFAYCTGKVYSFLNRVLLPSEERYQALKIELQNALGLSLEKAIFGLHNRMLEK